MSTSQLTNGPRIISRKRLKNVMEKVNTTHNLDLPVIFHLLSTLLFAVSPKKLQGNHSFFQVNWKESWRRRVPSYRNTKIHNIECWRRVICSDGYSQESNDYHLRRCHWINFYFQPAKQLPLSYWLASFFNSKGDYDLFIILLKRREIH